MDNKFEIFEFIRMNLKELRTFLTIVETGSLARTAENLNVTQSTVTARLQSLEQEIGQRLINRSKSGATVTGAGMRLMRYAETITDLWRQARQETGLPRGMSGICNLACEPDLWPELGERLFHRLLSDQPDMAISVWLGGSSDIAGWLGDGKSDLALTYHPGSTDGQDLHALRPDRLVLVSDNPDSPIRFDPDYVFVEGGQAFGRDHAAAYADAGTARINFGNATLGLAHLLRHGGSAYLPHRLVADHLGAGRLHLLADAPEYTRRIFLVSNRSAQRTWPWYHDIRASLAA